MFCIELPFITDPHAAFERLRGLPYPALLESAGAERPLSRFHLMTAAPSAVVRKDRSGLHVDDGGTTRLAPDLDPLDLVRRLLGPVRPAASFSRLAIGYLGYESAGVAAARTSEPGPQVPPLVFAVYDWCCVTDLWAGRTMLMARDRSQAQRAQRWLQHEAAPAGSFCLQAPLEPLSDQAAYVRAYARIQQYIQAGDCYQVNLTRAYRAPYAGDTWPLYQALTRAIPSPFSACLHYPFGHLLSVSPERWLQLCDGGALTTQPIKGTRPRAADSDRDRSLADELQRNPKDRAENLMITDLMRNDLGRVCRTGSVRVDELFAIRSLANVHQLVSTVRGQLAPGEDALTVLRACFPPGSVTGAPKIRATEIISELEPFRRSAYCGAIGYVNAAGEMDFNVAIRTLICDEHDLYVYGGGAIVADSDLDAELAEIEHKIGPILTLLRGLHCG